MCILRQLPHITSTYVLPVLFGVYRVEAPSLMATCNLGGLGSFEPIIFLPNQTSLIASRFTAFMEPKYTITQEDVKALGDFPCGDIQLDKDLVVRVILRPAEVDHTGQF
jgi:hypothetical protein